LLVKSEISGKFQFEVTFFGLVQYRMAMGANGLKILILWRYEIRNNGQEQKYIHDLIFF
jgi:hypothetical protein